jgi:hypothetical protein
MPRVRWRWKRRKAITTGIAARVAKDLFQHPWGFRITILSGHLASFK